MQRKDFLIPLVVTLLIGPLWAAEANELPYGIEKRVPWTTSKITGTPDPPLPYRTERAFPKLKFEEPLAMARAPGSDRLFVAERYGRIYSFPNDSDVEKADLLLDFLNGEKGIYGFAFHPKFATNGYFYVTYVLHPTNHLPNGSRLSRFRVRKGDPPRADLASETILLEWHAGGHNGGCLKFGPDGYLYIVIGDASDIADGLVTGQDISDLPASVLRIDVDRTDPGKRYRVPKDNPFVDMEDARPEIWAYGLRQLWKMSFDRETGDLWGCHIGQDLWEMVHLIEKGGNYGWSVTEGNHPFRPDRERGPTPIIPPIVEHDHTEARSLTGGFVYRGSQLKTLVGAYIYGDYDTGKLWGLRYDGEKVTSHRELADSTIRLVGFAEDDDGELYLVDHMGGGIHRLVLNPASRKANTFPRRLSETGLFASAKDHIPAAGLIPYSINAPNWDDGALKERFIALPGESKIEFDGLVYPQQAPGAPHGWRFPDGSVLVQTLALEMEAGNPASRRRLETRILHLETILGSSFVGDQYWHSYTYVWNDEQTDAVLLESKNGLDRTLTIVDADAPGHRRQQTWHFPSRAECSVCHNVAAKHVIGVNTLQMNRSHDYGRTVDNQLRTLEHIGVFTKPLPAPPQKLPRLVDPSKETAPLDRRARDYLHANCAHCHRKWGGGNADFRLLSTIDLDAMGIAGIRPAHGGFEIVDAEILAPGDPHRSVLFYRMSTIGGGRMPRLGSRLPDEAGLKLIHRWIEKQPSWVADDAVKAKRIERARTETTAALARLRNAESSQQRDEPIERLLDTTRGALRLVQAIDDGQLTKPQRDDVIARATVDAPQHIRDIYERYIPEDQRTKRLGSVIDAATILALEGDVTRGTTLFFEAAQVQCRNCHKIQGRGNEVGPDLGQIGKKYDRSKLLESILEPSKEIEAKYVVYLVQTKNGELHTGLLVKNSKEEVILKDAKGKPLRVGGDELALLLPQQQSLMPDLLVRDMTAQQVADLLAYLVTLRGEGDR